ncbi:hypothetical protein [Hymenobacter cavernae]|uniref:hypothetical protein n=1 Tax=Hymenobacter cavernae TaxID=2044852 RepID=UPI00166DA14D|nr:hypothetical protein [Hymenobacter cavernae]
MVWHLKVQHVVLRPSLGENRSETRFPRVENKQGIRQEIMMPFEPRNLATLMYACRA